jgi:hypothetical protein
MDHSRVPVIEALQAFRERGDDVYGPPGHKQGRGVDPRVLEVELRALLRMAGGPGSAHSVLRRNVETEWRIARRAHFLRSPRMAVDTRPARPTGHVV